MEKVKVGKVGVGCIVGACHNCDSCANDLENYCPKVVFTYNGIYYDGTVTYDSYSDFMVVDQRYIVQIPNRIPLNSAALLLCVGITVYSPLKYFGLGELRRHVAIVGLGGLGHVAVKFAKALGCKVTVISTSPSKKAEALEHLGRKTMAGSGIGGMKKTQEIIDFAVKHNIKTDIEVVLMDYVNQAMERLEKGDVRYRFVIDVGNTLAATKPEVEDQ
ncbi:hypothetical protein V6N11_014491 [Hibiscus sabdariffa]|uniref:Mannitol dehydrogenase n=1 Tax=Hibiscus sabdariffa TaxID=183260 RepID=A0ABR2TP69_9ROSI